MKRFLSTLLCAVLLLGLLPAVSPPAHMKGPIGTVTPNRTNACVGDSVTWTITGIDDTGISYKMYFDILRNGDMYRFDYNESRINEWSHSYKMREPGTYVMTAWLLDLSNGFHYVMTSPKTVVSLRPAAKITNVEVKSGASLKITWNKIAGATGYFVERSTGKTTGYKQVKATTAMSFTDTSLKAGTRYYYRVRAYNAVNGEKWPSSKYSAAAAGVPLAKAAITDTSSVSASQIELTWKKAAGATGYQVFRSSSKTGTFSAIRKINALSMIVTGMEPGNTYYFKVRAYIKINTATYYGPMSAYRSGRTMAE